MTSPSALNQVLTPALVPTLEEALQAQSNIANPAADSALKDVAIEIGSATPATAPTVVLFSRTKTESQFFQLHPDRQGKFTLADKALAELTDEVLEPHLHPMYKALYHFIDSVAAIYSSPQKILEKDLQIMLEGLDGHLKTIETAAPSNVDAAVFKALQVTQSLQEAMKQKSLVSQNPEIGIYLISRLKSPAPAPFQTVEELGLNAVAEKNEPKGRCISLSTVLKTGLAVGVVIGGYYAYTADALTHILSSLKGTEKPPNPGSDPKADREVNSESLMLTREFKYGSSVDQKTLHDVAATPGIISLLVQENADLWKPASDDQEYCLLRVASSIAGKAGNEFVADEVFVTLFRSGLETNPQSRNYMTSDHVQYAMNDLLAQGRVGVFEKLGNEDVKKLLQRMSPQHQQHMWVTAKYNPKASEILEKAGAHLSLMEEFERAKTLPDSLIETIMKDERLISKLVESKADLLKTGPDKRPLLVEYVRYNPLPEMDTYNLLKGAANWPSDVEEMVLTVAYNAKKHDFLAKLHQPKSNT